jgi:hypothetical protein
MRLKSCTNCGIVLDLTYIELPEVCNADGSIDHGNAIWSNVVNKFVPIIFCPVCKKEIEIEDEV